MKVLQGFMVNLKPPSTENEKHDWSLETLLKDSFWDVEIEILDMSNFSTSVIPIIL